MDIYIIRHAHAMQREVWEGADLLRPLTDKGIYRAELAFKKFVRIFKKPDLIVTSDAERCKGTASILNKYCKSELKVSEILNPGASATDYHNVIREMSNYNPIALIGHEPDISMFISGYLTEGKLGILMKKGSICHISDGLLVNLIQQKILIG